MPIINRGQATRLVEWHRPAGGNSWRRRQFSPTKKLRISAFGTRGETVLRELELVAAHFGVNKSRAFQIALHLTAKAIKQNRALPDV